MKKIFAIAFTLLMLVACKSTTGADAGSGSWLDGNRDSEMGDQTNAVNVVYFAFDKSMMDHTAKDKIKQQADMWKASQNKPTLLIEGYCDKMGDAEYNIALGDRRAFATKKELEKNGVPSDKLETISYGKERPAVTGDDAHSLALNRRTVTIAVKN